MRRQTWAVGVLACLMGSAGWAGTIRHDVPDSTYVDYGDTFHLVGGVSAGLDSFGTGTVIAPEWVLTAAHVVAGVTESTYITFDTDPDPADPDPLSLSGLFLVTQVAIHEYYNDVLGPAGGFDVALLHLERPVTHYPIWDRYRSSPAANGELGKQGTAVGFGVSGTGLTGYVEANWDLARRAGDNRIDALASHPLLLSQFTARDVVDPVSGLPVHFTQQQIAEQFILSDFDAPRGDPTVPAPYDTLNPLGDANPLPLEFSVAPGDSGGPLFLDDGNGLVVGGINSFIHGPPPPDGDGTDNATYGDLSGYLRVSAFNGWIDDVIGIPEPTGAVLALLLGAMTLARRDRC